MRLLAPATVLFSACSLFQSEPEAPPERESFGTFLALSDSETATDYAATKTQVWVGTTQGLLRYDEGVEQPVRLRSTDGLPGEEIHAVGANDDTVWAATNGGLVKIGGGQVEPHISDVPFVGRVRALTVSADGRLWVGGTQGLVRFTGSEWSKWNDRYDILQAVEHESGLWLATAQNGVALLKGSTLYEHTVTGGLPAPLARNVVPVGDGNALALTQGIDGTSLAYLHDDRWYTYTLRTDEKLVALVDLGGDPTLVTPTRLLKIVFDVRGLDESSRFVLAALGPEKAEPRQYRVSPVTGVTPPPPAREVENPPLPRAPMPPPDESPGDGPDLGFVARPLEVDAPVLNARSRGSALLLGTTGLGVVRVEGDGVSNFRTRDLVVTDRPFSVATDGRGISYVLTREGRAAQFDGERLSSVNVTDDPSMRIVAFATGGGGASMTAFALAHAPGTAWWRVFKRDADRWTLHVDRELKTADGVEDVTFFGVDQAGEFWLGIKVHLQGRVVERGIAVMSPDRPEVVYHHSTADPARDGPGAKRIPDTLSGVAFAGSAWFASLDGVVQVNAEEVHVYGEEDGVLGGVVGAIDVAPGGIPYVATHGGIGHFEEGRWVFERDRSVVESHPIALAVDGEGRIWSGGTHGVLVGVGGRWRKLDRRDGLLSEEVTSIRVDGSNRVWFVTKDGISVLLQRLH